MLRTAVTYIYKEKSQKWKENKHDKFNTPLDLYTF